MFDLYAEVTGITAELRALNASFLRIAEALERISPRLAVPRDDSAIASERWQESQDVFHLAESPEEYQERTSADAALALSLGVAPWSPAFQRAISEMRSDILRAKELAGEEVSDDEAASLIREAFQTAKAQANQRQSRQGSGSEQ
jgi:hypothetical protein